MSNVGNLLQELDRLQKQAKSTLYRRLEIANELLEDDDFVRKQGGSISLAEKMLADRYFMDWRGVVDFDLMIQLFRHFGKDQWEEYRYDVGAMLILYRQKLEVTTPTGIDRPKYKEMCEALEDKIAKQESAYRVSQEKIQKAKTELDILRERCRELEDENNRLKELLRSYGVEDA